VGLTLLTLATGAASIGLLINVEYARPSGWLMVGAFGMAELGEWIIPIVCGAIGWTRQMRLSLIVCAITSVWCIGNHLADLQATALIGMERHSQQYASAAIDADKARADGDGARRDADRARADGALARTAFARFSEAGTIKELEAMASEANAEATHQEQNGGRGKLWEKSRAAHEALLARLSDARAKDAARDDITRADAALALSNAEIARVKGELRAAATQAADGHGEAPGAALVLSAIFGIDANTTARELSMVRAFLGVMIVKVVTYWTLPAIALLRVAAQRKNVSATNEGNQDAVKQDAMTLYSVMLTDKSVMEADSAEAGQEVRRRTSADDGHGPKAKVRRRTRRTEKTHSAPMRQSLISNDISNVVPFQPQTHAERGKLVAELHEKGVSNCAIARQLGVSERTVRRDLSVSVKPFFCEAYIAAE
jgi:hypothetical protein